MSTEIARRIEFTFDEVGINCISTLELSRITRRSHKDILRIFRTLRSEGRLIGATGAPIAFYQDGRNRQQSMYLLTEAGCTLMLAAMEMRTPDEREFRKKLFKGFEDRQMALIKSSKPRTTKGKYGYVAAEEGDKEHHYKRVLREGRTDKELDEGKMLHLHYSGTGMFASRDAVRCFTYRKDGSRIEQLVGAN